MYNSDLTWDQLSAAAAAASETLKDSLLHANEAYEEWISFKAGRTSTAIAAALSATSGKTITAAQVDDAAACFQVFLELHNFAAGVAGPVQGNRYFAMRQFS